MKTILQNILLFLLFTLYGFSANGYEALVLKSNETKPYEIAIKGFKTVSNGKIYELDLSQTSDNQEILKDKIEKLSPNIVITIGAKALSFANNNINNIPILYCMVLTPEKVITNNKNIIGIDLMTPFKAQAKKLKSLFPNIKNVGVMYNPNNTGTTIKEAKKIFKDYGIDLVTKKIYTEKAVPKTLRSFKNNIDLLWLFPDVKVISKKSFQHIILYNLRNNIPIFSYAETLVRSGCLLSFSSNYFNIGQQAGTMANNIIEQNMVYPKTSQPDHMDLVLNKILAQKFNVKLDENHLKNSDEKVFFYNFEVNNFIFFRNTRFAWNEN